MKRIIYCKNIDNWSVSWENAGDYRLWCKQEHYSNDKTALVVMLNPGSLSGTGDTLKKDTTLRIIRDIFLNTGYNPHVINLYTFATPKPNVLFDNWEKKDCPDYSLEEVNPHDFSAIMYAYGAYERKKGFEKEIKERINVIKTHFSSLSEIDLPLAKTGTPKHPMRIQIEELKEVFKQKIKRSAMHS